MERSGRSRASAALVRRVVGRVGLGHRDDRWHRAPRQTGAAIPRWPVPRRSLPANFTC